VSRQIIAVETPNAVSDGTFAATRITVCVMTMAQSASLPDVSTQDVFGKPKQSDFCNALYVSLYC
jgi:hypothetical protein